ncbi:MAG TPA: outer membrane protein assembly factor BamD, partial [Blastocatellia bacterium]|nr:outer membrane protein assembly factor BamD [Blastocatellia bacterium]
MSKKFGVVLALGLILLPVSEARSFSNQKDKEIQMKLALDELKAEVIVLGRQVRTMQESLDRNSGQVTALITQIVDNVSAIRQAQSRVAEGSTSALASVTGLGERLSATNERIDRLSGQLAELKKLVENLPKLPTFTTITPGNPDQLFAAAYGDYSRGNYDLAVSEFRQYVETYPSSEMADNAQYWIGECLLSKKQYNEAIAEFDKLSMLFPKGDKVPGARFKKGMALMELGQSDAAR